jgi:hypothetical protein
MDRSLSLHTPLTVDIPVSSRISMAGDAGAEDPLIEMADPARDSRIAVISPGALDIACQLIRRGYQTASVMRVDERCRAHEADVVIIPQAVDAAFIARAIPFAHRLLAPMGVVVLRLPADGSGRTAAFARQQMVLNGFAAVRVTTRRGETLLGAELPLHGRLACA